MSLRTTPYRSSKRNQAKKPSFTTRPAAPTSWDTASGWYDKLVGDRGHYYHQHVIVPGVERLLQLTPGSRVLDIGCGQGVFARVLHKSQSYVGIDASPQLIESARQHDHNARHEYHVADATKSLPEMHKDFTHAVAILSLQNMADPSGAIRNVSKHLISHGIFVIVLNHPYFRIPRQSGWGVHEANKQQYRWVTRYLSSMNIPIAMHPGKREKGWDTTSFHEPLEAYVRFLAAAGMAIVGLEEWASDKKNQPGPHAKREDRAREEIPLFMAIVAKKI